jgi:hypothetical protein
MAAVVAEIAVTDEALAAFTASSIPSNGGGRGTCVATYC